MKLPAISVPPVPVCLPPDTRPVSRSRGLMVPPTTLPTIPDSARLCGSYQPVPRLNPLLAPLQQKRTVSLETSAAHHHNQQRALVMQRAEHLRCHQMWRAPFYGTSTDKQEYRRHLREQLQKQMEQRGAAVKMQLAQNFKEAERLREADRLALSRDRELCMQRSRALTAYRDENKRLMEKRWNDKKVSRCQEAKRERELLLLNPINWTGTLK